jgi:hypothetical protein
MTPQEIQLYKESIEQEKLYGFSRWGTFGWIEKLANGDITKFKAVKKQNFIECLELLAYWKERDEYVKQEQEKERKQQQINN